MSKSFVSNYNTLKSFIYSLLDVDRLKYYTFLYKQYKFTKKLCRQDRIKVVFIAMNVSMWRYQSLYELMHKDERFDTYIVISPAVAYSKQQREKDIIDLKSFFSSKKIAYIDFCLDDECPFDIRDNIDPDILFYPQPYDGVLVKEHSYRNFLDKLICYYPYAFWTSKGRWSYDTFFHNHAWRLFYSTQLNYQDAKGIAYNKGRNVVVTGYPNSDLFLAGKYKNVWKHQEIEKKKVIWAPHFTIQKGISSLYLSNFLWMADSMLEIAEKYKDIIQFAFKPHPRLLTELYKNENWGKEKTDNYYHEWEMRDNTQLETGHYIDLFMTSDAMIHDSSSFSVEYLYTKNPVMFITKDIDRIRQDKNALGNFALDCHYIGSTINDIIYFLEKPVLGSHDDLVNNRNSFYHKFLIPPHNKSVAQNTMDAIRRYI